MTSRWICKAAISLYFNRQHLQALHWVNTVVYRNPLLITATKCSFCL